LAETSERNFITSHQPDRTHNSNLPLFLVFIMRIQRGSRFTFSGILITRPAIHFQRVGTCGVGVCFGGFGRLCAL
ncbi:hypothetical protein, partial [Dickeya undicola]|uniref:hypothetical protein n=1 Tax=Dickeya undicola TaxID=1577887 RepID=UPI001374F307